MGYAFRGGMFDLEKQNQEIEQEKDVFQIIENMKLEMKIPEHAPKADREYMRLMFEGETEQNLDKLYHGIEALERGCGVSLNQQVSIIFQNAFEKSPERMVKTFTQKSLLERYIYLAMCSEDILYGFVDIGCVGDTYMLYECLRQLINRQSWNKNKRDWIFKGIRNLAEHDSVLWRRWINTQEYNKRWITLLSVVLPVLSKTAVDDYANTIRMDFPIEKVQEMECMLRQIPEEKRVYIFENLADTLYQRWIEYLENLHEEKRYQSGLVINGYAALIEEAVCAYCKTKKIWEDEILMAIFKFTKDMEAWYESGTQRLSVFWVDMTQIFFLLIARKAWNHSLDKKLKNKWDILKQVIKINRYYLLANSHKSEQNVILDLLE